MFRLKEHISIALATALILGTLWQTFTVIHFYMNREAITEAHCINKDRPDLNCKGQCHLKKQLEAANPEQDQTQTNSSSKASILLFVFAQTTEMSSAEYFRADKVAYPNTTLQTNNYISEIFCPPEFC